MSGDKAKVYLLDYGQGGGIVNIGWPCGWDETFDEASFAALAAKYTAVHNFAAGTGAGCSISGGSLVVPAGSNCEFGAHDFTPREEIWLEMDVSFSGSYDTTLYGIPLGFGAAKTGTPVPGLGMVDAQLGYARVGGAGPYLLAASAQNADATQAVATDGAGNSGTHAFVLGASLLTPTSYKTEVWVDGASVASVVATKNAGEGFGFANMGVTNNSAGVDISVSRWRVTCGPRASNPFGVTL